MNADYEIADKAYSEYCDLKIASGCTERQIMSRNDWHYCWSKANSGDAERYKFIRDNDVSDLYSDWVSDQLNMQEMEKSDFDNAIDKEIKSVSVQRQDLNSDEPKEV